MSTILHMAACYRAMLFFNDDCDNQEPHSLYVSGRLGLEHWEVAKLLLDRPNTGMVSVQVDF